MTKIFPPLPILFFPISSSFSIFSFFLYLFIHPFLSLTISFYHYQHVILSVSPTHLPREASSELLQPLLPHELILERHLAAVLTLLQLQPGRLDVVHKHTLGRDVTLLAISLQTGLDVEILYLHITTFTISSKGTEEIGEENITKVSTQISRSYCI